ncbi:hypothetical protein MPSYJ_44430 [Mycolicibacterium psychrotolerans]|uniref:Uncharacterized protein n=1 Tax=Mycolicibacterium psychrotolerans TaxID=216929 RepID=A0A7I7MGL5_9MYCO|nr:hypothetical protein MPSYJ_44430 [Mycolicibacterium psychrotolerans]
MVFGVLCGIVLWVSTAKVAASLPAPVQLVVVCLAGLPVYILALRVTAHDLTAAAFTALRSVRNRDEDTILEKGNHLA